MFSYPFSRSGNETEDGTHYPRLADLQYLCELAGVRLKVVALWREPVDAIMSMNNRGLPKIWRRAGRTFKLHKQVELFLSQLDEMHSQLAALPPDSFRVVNYTHMLGHAKEYVRDLAAFLEVPEAHLDRAFTLSAKAKPKKRPRAPSSLPEGTWSDAVRQDFIQQRLAEAAASAKPPRCCDEWTRRLATQRLAQMPSPASSTKTRPRPPHWFTTWAQTAPPPLRAQAISFTHVVNPFDPGNSSEHKQAQRVTLASISHASALAAAQGIAVEVVCAVFPEDEAHVRREPLQCLLERLNVSAATALPQFRHPVRLPFLNMLLYAGYSRGSGKYLIYTNIDIGLQPPFYLKLARQMQVMPGVPISSIREEFEHVDPAFGVEHAIARRGTGLQHPGHDCWAFPREWVPRLILGFTLVGVSMVATSLMQALHALSGCRMSLLSPKLTFHFVDGDSVVKHPSNQRARNDKIFTGLYTAWNCAQFARDRRDVLEVYPEYNQCWFSQQARTDRHRDGDRSRPPPLCEHAHAPLPARTCSPAGRVELVLVPVRHHDRALAARVQAALAVGAQPHHPPRARQLQLAIHVRKVPRPRRRREAGRGHDGARPVRFLPLQGRPADAAVYHAAEASGAPSDRRCSRRPPRGRQLQRAKGRASAERSRQMRG